jgi:hypothetical protein
LGAESIAGMAPVRPDRMTVQARVAEVMLAELVRYLTEVRG